MDNELSELISDLETDSYGKKYKKLEYKDLVFLYRVVHIDTGYGYEAETRIYSYVPTIRTVRKFWIFGKKIQKKEHELLFTIYFDIESPNRTKDDIRKKFDNYIELKQREEELKNGIII